MANLIQWAAAWNDEGDVLTTQLDGLATSNASALGSTVVDNSANLDQYFIAEFLAGGSFTPTAGGYLTLYAIPSADGTNYANNYATGASETLPGEHLCCVMTLVAAAGTYRCISRPFSLGPGKYKFILFNDSGASLPANTNVVAIYSTNDEVQ